MSWRRWFGYGCLSSVIVVGGGWIELFGHLALGVGVEVGTVADHPTVELDQKVWNEI